MTNPTGDSREIRELHEAPVGVFRVIRGYFPCGFVALYLMCFTQNSLAFASGVADAAKSKDTETVRLLLDQRADVNQPQPDGATALHWAAYWDDIETAELLIRAKANVNAANDYGVTPLMLACTNGSGPMVKTLLNAGANPNSALPTGQTALMTCARAGSIVPVKLLLDRGAYANAKEVQKGQTALMWAAAQKHAEVAEALIGHGADVHVRSKSGFTPLLFAARAGDVESSRVLLKAGADVNESVQVKNGIPGSVATPLLMASASGHEALSIFFLENGANPNAWDGGAAPLHYAVMEGTSYLHPRSNMPELVKVLLAHGANPNVRFMRSNVAARGYDTTNTGGRGATPFLMAAAAPNPTMMRILLQGGADPQLPNSQNVTPLMAAAGVVRSEAFTERQQNDAVEAIKMLLALGADINAADAKGRTALHGATRIVANPIIEYLAEHGAKIDARDIYQQTPLSIASGIHLPWVPTGEELGEEGALRKSTAELLLKYGATPLNTPGYFTPIGKDSDPYRFSPRQGKIPGVD
jgi:uncharacterized protein